MDYGIRYHLQVFKILQHYFALESQQNDKSGTRSPATEVTGALTLRLDHSAIPLYVLRSMEWDMVADTIFTYSKYRQHNVHANVNIMTGAGL